MTSLCDEIWLAMRHQGVKLKDIANEADIDPASVSLALRNKTAISPRVALAVEALTGITVEYIFERQADVYIARKLAQVDAIRKEKAPVSDSRPEALGGFQNTVTVAERKSFVNGLSPVSASRQPNAEEEKSGPCLAASRDVGGAIGP